MTITSQSKSFLLALVLLIAALVAPAAPSAKGGGEQGVQAELDGGTLRVDGGDRPNSVALRLKAGDQTRIQVDAGDNDSADFSFARGNVDAINIRMGNGRDSVRIDDANGAFTDAIPTTIAGGNGDDTLGGGLGVETFNGGNGDDFVDGGRGHDRADLGRGDDTFQWDPGEGSDSIEGQSGSDRMLFNGAQGPGAETVTMTANGGRLIFFRQPGAVTMNTDDVDIDVAGNGSGADVTGLATAVSIKHADPTDSLVVNTLAGADNVNVAGVAGVLDVLVND